MPLRRRVCERHALDADRLEVTKRPSADVVVGGGRLEALLGEGGIGQVFEATHLALGTAVAVKVLRPELADTELLRKRFEREARALTELSHPHIVAVTDVGVSDGTPYLVMEKVEGRPLSSVLRAGPLDPPRALELTRQILRAVGHAHERGLVHRDLKPGNILLREVDGRDHAVVLDFGLARYTGERGRQGTALTRRGSLIGTPAY
ncbi:MAG: serine/threonine protein kinase, partial [Myxococcales bacterium]|nr:serine/threonine protein kinase [Myxococcales bacterium]